MESRRIFITGNAGSGKTTLSHRLAQRYSLPRHGLDSVVWQSGWRKTPDDEKRAKIQRIVETERWIIDGVSSQAFKTADEIYFLDLSLYLSLMNILKRFLETGPLKTREDLPNGCLEIVGTVKAIKVAIRYQKYTRPLILDLISSHPQKKIHWIKSRSELQKI